MKCHHIQEGLGFYWDLSKYDARKHVIDEHVRTCTNCAKQFALWRESWQLLNSERELALSVQENSVAEEVMMRIYADSPWQQPLVKKASRHSESFRYRFLVATAIACMLLLGCMLYALPGVIESASFEASQPSVQMTVSMDWTHTNKPDEGNNFSATMFVVSLALLSAILLGLSWYNRLRE